MTADERLRLVTRLAWQIYRDSVVTERGLRPPQEAESAAENWVDYVEAHHPDDADEILRAMADGR